MISLKLRFRVAAICLAAILVLGILPSGSVYADDGVTDSVTDTETEPVVSDLEPEEDLSQDTASEEPEEEPTETPDPDSTSDTASEEPEPTETSAPDPTPDTDLDELEAEPTETPDPDSTQETADLEPEEEPTETPAPDSTPDTTSAETEEEPTETPAPDSTQETVSVETEEEPTETPAPDSTPDTTSAETEEEPTETPAPDSTQETVSVETEEEPTETPAPLSEPDTTSEETEEAPAETSEPEVTEETASDEMTEDLAEAADSSLTINNVVLDAPADNPHSFTYEIFVWNPNASGESRGLSGTYGDVTFSCKKYAQSPVTDTITLAAGYYGYAYVTIQSNQSKTITGLPESYSYCIIQDYNTEGVDASHNDSQYYLKHLTNTTGEANVLYSAACADRATGHNEVTYTFGYAPGYLRLGAEVSSSNPDSLDDEFEFTIYLYKTGTSANTPFFDEDDVQVEISVGASGNIADPNLGSTLTFKKTKSTTLDGMGKPGVYNMAQITLKHGQFVILKNLGAGYGYYIVEKPDIHYMTAQYSTLVVYTGKENHNHSTLPACSYGDQYIYLDSVQDGCIASSSIDFLNAQVSLSITKQVVNSNTTRDFVFNVFFAEINPDTGRYTPLSEGDYTLTYSGSNLTGEEPTSVHIQKRSDITHADLTTTDWYGYTTTSTWSVAQIRLAAGQTVTIEGLPLGVFYDIVEVPVTNYTVSATNLVNAVVGSNHNVYYPSFLTEDASATFINTYTQPEGLDLTISKTVTGNMGSRTKAFSFSITLTDASGAPLSNWDIPVLLPDQTKTVYTTDASGVLTLSLAHGQSLTLQDLPQGTHYTITETDPGSYTTSFAVTGGSYDTAAEHAQSGALDGEDDMTVAVTNNLDMAVPTGIKTDLQPALLTTVLALGGLLWLVLSKKHKPV
jgi:hypothetical protein